MKKLICFVACMVGMMGSSVYAQDSADEMARKLANPVGSVYSLPFEFTADNGADNGDAYILNLQPVIPVSLGENWNLINRVIIPFIDAPGAPVGGVGNPEPIPSDRVFGLGDIKYTMFFSPASPGKVIWGLGPMLGFPTATDDSLGSKKWTAGPSLVLLTQPAPWTIGTLIGNLWSYEGDDDRADVNQFFFQYFVNYDLGEGWYLTSTPTMTANWNAESSDDRWLIPVGGGAGKVFNIGEQPIRTQLQAFYNVEKPTGAPDGAVMFTVQLVFPR